MQKPAIHLLDLPTYGNAGGDRAFRHPPSLTQRRENRLQLKRQLLKPAEEFRRNWARLIQKVYHADPLLCPKCSEPMRIISFIEDSETIKKILVHLSLWETRNHDPPPRKVNMQKYISDLPEIKETVYDDFSQLTPYDDDYSQVAEEQYS